MRILMVAATLSVVAGIFTIVQPNGLLAQEYREATLAVTGMT